MNNSIVMKHLSYSSISLWGRCQRLWWLRYIHKVKPNPTSAQIYGSAVHEILEQIFMGKEYSVAKSVNKGMARIVQTGRNVKPEKIAEMIESIKDMVLDPNVLEIAKGFDIAEVEREITFDVPGVPIPVLGYIDAIQTNGIPMDIKTSGYDWTETQVRDEIQPLFYLTGLNRPTGEFAYFIIVKNALQPRAYVMEHKYMDHNQRCCKIVKEAWDQMEPYSTRQSPSPAECKRKWCTCHQKKLKRYV